MTALPAGLSVDVPITLPRPGRYRITVKTSEPVDLSLSEAQPVADAPSPDMFDALSTRVHLRMTVRKRAIVRTIELAAISR